jgi:protein subunit release factor A
MKPSRRLSSPPYHTDRATVEREVIVESFRARGPGGQHRNVTESAVRLTHLPSGVRAVAAESRSQHRNREVAFERLIARLEQLNRVPAPRVPTRASRAAVERRIKQKKLRQKAKQLRAAIRGDE